MSFQEPRPSGSEERRGRLVLVDVARAVALLAMAHYHFMWDLEFFGYAEAGTSAHGWPRLYARLIAGSFLFLVGVSLVLGHWPRIRPRRFLVRLAQIVAAAVLITAASVWFSPDTFIFYGILHSIAVSSVAGLLFLKAPPAATLVAAAVAFALPHYFRSSFFDPLWLSWTGLSQSLPRSNDFVPFFPWFGPVLLGIAAARIAEARGLFDRMARWQPAGRGPVRHLALVGRHSLAFYLVHQPVLLALLWTYSQVAPPDFAANYQAGCVRSCMASNDRDLCTRFCACVTETASADGTMEKLRSGEARPDSPEMRALAEMCTAKARAAQ